MSSPTFGQPKIFSSPMGHRKYLALLGALTVPFALASCGGDADGDDQGAETDQDDSANGEDDASNGEPVSGGEVTQVISVDTSTWDPARLPNMNPTLSASPFSAVYGQLLYSNVESGEVEPGLAESMTPNEDGTVWELTLRDGVEFSDGTAFDAEAVKTNWDRLADPETSAVSAPAAQSFESEVIDELTLELTTEEPDFFLDRVVASQLTFIVSPTAMDENPDVFTDDPVGAGPFVLSEAVSGSHYVYTPNENYWDEGKPYLDQLTIQVIGDRQQQRDTVSSQNTDLFIANAMGAEEWIAGTDMQLPSFDVGGSRSMFFNTARAPFDDPRAREAIALALDLEDIAYANEPEEGSTSPDSLFAEDSPFYDVDFALPSQDPDEAQRLFDELAEEGSPVEFSIVAGGAGGTRSAELIQSELGAYENVTVNLDIIPLPNFEEQVAFRGEFDLAIRPGSMFVNSPSPGIDQLLRTGGVNNISNYSSDEMDELLDAVRAESEVEDQRDALSEVFDLYLEELPWLPFGNTELVVTHIPELEGIELFEEGTARYQELYRTD
ncbi:ABC transporter substrate-binding protein [Nesterenkonia haasae]|uniref:ABC transporter substrate-binding protein n=1 Tax=Nesterenkonia haasae TaxID=2587813 RepID=UPI00139085A2|nr:ABC transporter substrate-binding protein [Nesterenkonia haasae]NDK31971.1 ABC transporter substrate-binding protein [Nesterenkonia haasae]